MIALPVAQEYFVVVGGGDLLLGNAPAHPVFHGPALNNAAHLELAVLGQAAALVQSRLDDRERMTERHDVFGIRTEQLFDQREVIDRLGELLRHHNAAVIGQPAMLGEEHFDHDEIFGELHQAVGVDIATLLERQSRKMRETIVGQGVLNLLVINAGGAENCLVR